MDSKTCDTNEKILRNLCRFCGAQNYKNLENPLNEIFLDVVDKLFSFSAETLNVFKICIDCQTFIESICKFYIQVKNVSKIFLEIENSIKDDIPINILQLNSKYSFKTDEANGVDTEYKIVGKVKNDSELIKIENNPIKENNSDYIDSDDKSVQEVIEIVKQEIYEESESVVGCSENKTSKTNSEKSMLSKTKKSKKLKSLKEKHKSPSKRRCKCETCGKQFSNNSNLLEHRKLHWPSEKKEASFFKCQHCDARYPRKGKMLNHIRTKHLKEKPFECKICKKEFSSHHHLVRHERNIHEKNDSACPICKKIFTSSRIKEHIKKHAQNCIPCTICGDLFRPKHLERHMLVHSDVKAYTCNYCGSSFKREVTLQFHMIAHTDLKPFPCRFCSHNFVNQSNRKRHEQVMHPNEMQAKKEDSYENDKKLPSIEQLHKMLEDLKAGKKINFYSKEKS